jgi:GTP-binding protein HflX
MKSVSIDPTINARTLILGVQAPYNRTKHIESYFEEFLNLIKTNDVVYERAEFVRLRETDPSYFFTKGRLEELKKLCDELEIEHVIISEVLSPQQERNIEDFLHVTVFDRTALILEIFEKGSHSAEGKIQVKIARFQHRRTRLAGKGIFMAQQAGMIGARGGPGETLKERESRLIDDEITKYKRELERLAKSRETQRKQRSRSGLPMMCLIGYTNAGKSTILNALTHSDVLAEDKLFATLDTTTRELYLHKTKIGLISDTVGFIQNLPHSLIESFKSTLSELQYADLLLQVVDASDASWEKHIRVVYEVLSELGVSKEMVYIFNKIDRIPESERQEREVAFARYNPRVLTDARTKDGLQLLKDYLYTWYQERTAKEPVAD